ncbi:MAG: phosphate acyltransferase PlsX [Myxococcales bacterium]|nr:phosphate acyltransferase PlsX [Myxococcales bacterium]
MTAPIRILLDAMGGDRAPSEPVRAAAEISRTTAIHVVLCGEVAAIERELATVEHARERIEIMPAVGAIGMDEKPREAIAAKPDASLCVAMRALGEGKGDALVSAGSTGALVLASSQWVPRIEGIERAALAAVYPTQQRANNRDRFALLLDVGATVHCRPQDLLFFAYMGHAYASRISKVERPTIGLLNMGSEPTKGGETLVAAHALLRGEPRLNFIGNVEGNDIPLGKADVIVCEGLLGNVALKMAEGTGELFRNLGTWAFKQSLLWKLGLLLLSSGLRRLKDLTDYSEYGGAPLLGFTRPIIKAHGRSSAQAIGNAIKVAAKAARDGVCTDIAACARDFAAKQAQA